MVSREKFVPQDKSIFVATDVEAARLQELVERTCLVKGIGGYKVGFEVTLEIGLPESVKIVKEYTNHPIMYDHQKGGTDTPQKGTRFANVCAKAGVEAVILYPFGGAKTEREWIKAGQGVGLTVMVGGHMTQPEFLSSEGGFISDDAPDRIYTIAAENGVRDFVVPGNKIHYVRHYKELLSSILGKDNFTLYSPGFVTQGGKISEFAKVAGNNYHPIVGEIIYNSPDITAAAGKITRQLE